MVVLSFSQLLPLFRDYYPKGEIVGGADLKLENQTKYDLFGIPCGFSRVCYKDLYQAKCEVSMSPLVFMQVE